MINKTELKAIEYLISQGYKESEIIKNSNKTPDLICLDGKRYEIKYLYGNSLVFYSTQIKDLKDDDIILVFNKDELVNKFEWKDRDKISFYIRIQQLDGKSTIQLDKTTLEKLKELRLTNRDTYDEIIVRMIKAIHKQK
jgi:hypothetical protein